MHSQGTPVAIPPRPPTIVVPGAGASEVTITTPLTARDIAAIRTRRVELSNQLESADGRRNRLMEQLNGTSDATAKRGLEDRIALLDKRMLQLEGDIAETGRQLTSAPAGLVESTEPAPVFAGLGATQVFVLSGIFSVFVLAPLAVGAARMMWKRSNRPATPLAVFTETAQRLERLEQSIDTIALEIERVTEGQRFVTRLLSEGQPAAALGAGQRSPETVRSSE